MPSVISLKICYEIVSLAVMVLDEIQLAKLNLSSGEKLVKLDMPTEWGKYID